jgi:hypothetical protein
MDVRKKLDAEGIPPTAILPGHRTTITLEELTKVVRDRDLRREVIDALKDHGGFAPIKDG